MSRAAWIVVGLVLVAFFLAGGPGRVVKLVESAGTKKKLDGLLPHVRAKVVELRERLAAKGIKTAVGSTVRSDAEQAAQRAAGRSATDNSWHELRRAVDLYPVLPDGKTLAGDKDVELYRAMHAEAAALGFRGIAFNADGSKRYINGNVWDAPHLEFREGMTYAQAKAAGARGAVA